MEEIISYIMETPENVNGNILREKLKDFQKSGGSPSVLDDLIEGKSSIHLVSNANNVVEKAFVVLSSKTGEPEGLGQFLESVILLNATIIGASAFEGCSALTSVELPNATNIGASAFSRCALTSISLPNATIIGTTAFRGCSALTNISLPNATSIGAGAFANISSTAVINIGAAEGEITGAPWGAPEGVTINYNVHSTSE